MDNYLKKTIDKYAVIEATGTLGIEKKASVKEVKKIYRKLMHKWHPDKSQKNHEECADMTRKITDAYTIIIEYCENYTIDFSEKAAANTEIDYDTETFWKEHFGKDPLWGG